MIITCTCGASNRLPRLPKTRIRCGKCQRVFTPSELLSAQPEKPVDRPPQNRVGFVDDFALDMQDDDLAREFRKMFGDD